MNIVDPKRKIGLKLQVGEIRMLRAYLLESGHLDAFENTSKAWSTLKQPIDSPSSNFYVTRQALVSQLIPASVRARNHSLVLQLMTYLDESDLEHNIGVAEIPFE